MTGAFSLAGTSVVTGYYLSTKLSSFTITALSMIIVLVVLFPFYAKATMQIIRKLNARDWLLLIAQAFFGIFLFRMFLLLGVSQTSTAEAGILTGTTPAITAILAYFVLKEKLTVYKAAGITAAVLGILLLQGNSIFAANFSSGHFWGNILVLLAAGSESTFNIISRKQKTGENANTSISIHPMVQTLIVSAITLCLSIVPALLESPAAGLSALGISQYLALLWYGLAVTALAFMFFYAGAKRCDAYTIAAYSGLMPLTSMLLSLVLLREATTALQWIGNGMILLGMHLIGRKNRRRYAQDSPKRLPSLSNREDGYSRP